MHERRLAGTGRAHDRDELARGQVERHAAQCVHDVVADVVLLREVANVDQDNPQSGRSGGSGWSRAEEARAPRTAPIYWSLAVVVIGFAGAGGSFPANA